MQFRAKLWRYNGKAVWYFLTLPKGLSAEIKALHGLGGSAWGSLRVNASIGSTQWKTSIFPDSKAGAYLLPVKAAVRRAEGIDDGDSVKVTLGLAG